MKYSTLKVNAEYAAPIIGFMPASEVERIVSEMSNVCVCFTLNSVDAPLFSGVRTYANAETWRNADVLNRFFMLVTVDAEPETFEPRDLFEYAASVTSRADPGGADDKTNGESA